MTSYNTVWACLLAFASILLVMGLLLCLPFVLTKLREMHPGIDHFMNRAASWTTAAVPSFEGKASRQPAPKSLLRSLEVTQYTKDSDLERAVDDCCAICCCEYEAGQSVTRLKCSHLYHHQCITAWLKLDAVCPICKTHLLPQPPTVDTPSSEEDPAPAPATSAALMPALAPAPAPTPASSAALMPAPAAPQATAAATSSLAAASGAQTV